MISVPSAVKNLYKNDHAYKNIRIHFPNGERSDICNDLIVKNSVSFKESLCSQNTLKFGLCEASVFECETVGVGNVKGATIEVFVEIECPSNVTGAEWRVDLQKYIYSISYGLFTVDSCKRQADLNHRKVVGYSFLYYKENLTSDESLGDFFSKEVVETDNPYVIPIEAYVYSKYPNFCDISAYDTEPAYASYGSEVDRFRHELKTWQFDSYVYTFRTLSSRAGELHSYLSGTFGVLFDTNDFNVNPNLETDIRSMLDTISEDYGMPTFETVDFFDFLNLGYVQIYPPHAYAERTYAGGAGGTHSTYRSEIKGKFFLWHNIIWLSPFEINLEVERYPVYQPWNTETVWRGRLEILDKDDNIKALKIKNINADLTISFVREYTSGINGGWEFSGYSYQKAYEETDAIKMFNGFLEAQGLIGAYSRSGINLISLKRRFQLKPGIELYPGADLIPQGALGGKLLPKDYQSCWYDDSYMLPYGIIFCKFKTVETVEGETKIVDASYSLFLNNVTENTNPELYQTYKIENNEYLNIKTWTPEEIEDICSNIAENLDGVTYMPVDFKGRGLPYVEAGDTFEILTKSNDSITTIVLNRTITGEQTLTDSYKSV